MSDCYFYLPLLFPRRPQPLKTRDPFLDHDPPVPNNISHFNQSRLCKTNPTRLCMWVAKVSGKTWSLGVANALQLYKKKPKKKPKQNVISFRSKTMHLWQLQELYLGNVSWLLGLCCCSYPLAVEVSIVLQCTVTQTFNYQCHVTISSHIAVADELLGHILHS